MPWVWGFIDCGRTCCCMRCIRSLVLGSWTWRVEQVKPFVCASAKHQTETSTGNTHLYSLWWSSGDISFRFLEYVRSQRERQQRRAVRFGQTLSLQDISNSYSTIETDGPRESTAVVCDINKEMLKVGKEKAESLGITAGNLLNASSVFKLDTRSLWFCACTDLISNRSLSLTLAELFWRKLAMYAVSRSLRCIITEKSKAFHWWKLALCLTEGELTIQNQKVNVENTVFFNLRCAKVSLIRL